MYLRVHGTESPLAGDLVVPVSKYHAHRALILASLAAGQSRILGPTEARHVQFTIDVLRGLGTEIELDADGFSVSGGAYRPVRDTVSVGSSGTTLYFMIGLAALADAPVSITGQRYFQRRPVGPLLESLSAMGVRLSSSDGKPPITVHPGRPTGGHVRIPGTLSQWASGLLLVAPFATSRTEIELTGTLNESPYVTLTIEMMSRFGLEVEADPGGRRFVVEPGQEASPATIQLPPDLGSAAFGLAAAGLHPSDVRFHGLPLDRADGVDHPEAYVLELMREVGIPMETDGSTGVVRHDGVRLRGVEVDCREIPDMLPILATIGALAEGETRFRNVAHVRLKESDRVAAMLQLRHMGASVEPEGDDLVCRGVERLTAAPLSSYNDHRVLMALAVASTRARGESTLTYPNAYRISYPSFLDDMTSLGLSMSVEREEPRALGRPAARREPSVAIEQATAIPITEHVRRLGSRSPGELAVVDPSGGRTRTWSWSELCAEVDRTATVLLELGVDPGEAVAFQLPNVGEFPVLALAIMRIGGVCCPLMPIFRERELRLTLERSRARVLVVAERFRGRDGVAEAVELAGAPTSLEHVLLVDVDPGERSGPPSGGAVSWRRLADAVGEVDVDPDALEARTPAPDARAQLLFTSGTTGEPKGVTHRHDVLTRAVAMEIEHLGLGRDDRIFVPSPMAHQTGFLYGMWLAFFLGAPQVLQARWDPTRAASTLREWGGSFAQAATPFLADLVEAVEGGSEAPEELRIFVATGAGVPRVLAERATEVLRTRVCGAWGSTETCLGTLSAPDDPEEKVWGTDGRPLAGVEVRITDDEGAALPPGQEGNFELSSPCCFDGYLDRPDLTAEAFTADGWFRTGDLAILDEDGFLHVTGRVKDVVNRGGEKIPVAEIEELLHAHDAVAEAAIVAMPDERLGERACAFVALSDGEGFDMREMQRHLDRARVAKQYWPEHLEIVEALPRNPIGKVQKFELRERARELEGSRGKEAAL